MTAVVALYAALALSSLSLAGLGALAARALRSERPACARSLPPGSVLALPAASEGTE
jgi:hypothetical protein